MKRDLETLRDTLWKTFETAVEQDYKYENPVSTGTHTPTNLRILNRQAIGILGQALVQVETEIAKQKEVQAEAVRREKKQIKLA